MITIKQLIGQTRFRCNFFMTAYISQKCVNEFMTFADVDTWNAWIELLNYFCFDQNIH